MKKPAGRRVREVTMRKALTIAALVALGGFLLLEAGLSLEWRMVHDAPILMYMAFGMDHFGYVPYVDFFDMNAPGAHWAYLLIGRVFGYDDLGFRLADITWLALLLALTWLTLRRFGALVGAGGAILFGLIYMGGGSRMSLQREYIVLAPLAGAVLVATSLERLPSVARWLAVGVLFGLAATVKPASVIGFPAVVGFGVWEVRARKRGPWPPDSVSRLLAFSVVGLAFPVAAVILYLSGAGALRDFMAMARGYWPLYTELSRTHVVIQGSARAGYLMREWLKLGGRSVWLLPAAAGATAVLFRSTWSRADKRRVVLLIALMVCYSLYAVVGGKFWTYHWLPFSYFVILLASLTLVAPAHWKRLGWVPISALVLAAVVGLRPPSEMPAQLKGEQWLAPEVRRADRIAAYLRTNLRPGDTVQPLDWTGGAVHAMLMAEAPLATPFVYDFHFHHHVSTEYVQGLRRRLLKGLDANPPRFIIDVETMRPWVSGDDTESRFPALREFIRTNYEIARAGIGYRIYERREG